MSANSNSQCNAHSLQECTVCHDKFTSSSTNDLCGTCEDMFAKFKSSYDAESSGTSCKICDGYTTNLIKICDTCRSNIGVLDTSLIHNLVMNIRDDFIDDFNKEAPGS